MSGKNTGRLATLLGRAKNRRVAGPVVRARLAQQFSLFSEGA